MKTTTALLKISKLKKKIWGIQGGQGAGKTYSILQIIINHASSNANKEIYIASDELSKMRITVIKDFCKIMKSFNIFNKNEFTDGTLYRFKNGSFIKFIGLDKADIGKGLRSDVIFINEANKIKFETYRELTSRAKHVIIDFNPNREFWFHEEIMPRDDCDFIKLTFIDNECLSEEELYEILRYKELGYNEDGTEKNGYWANMWRVYGLGEIGRQQGAIFQNWEQGEFNETLSDAYGMDFGSRDPDAIVRVAIDRENKKIYAKEILYQNSLSTEKLAELVLLKIPKGKYVVADSQASRTIADLKARGVNIKAVEKNKIIDDIKLIQGWQIIISPDSINFMRELSNWIWLDKGGEVPIDKENHLIDAFRYIVQTLIKPQTKQLGNRFIKL